MQPGSESREELLVRQEWDSNFETAGWREGQTGLWKPKPILSVGGVEFCW